MNVAFLVQGKLVTTNRSGKMGASEKFRYGAELGELLRKCFQHPPYLKPPRKLGFTWKAKTFAAEIGNVSENAVGQWLRGDALPDQYRSAIIEVLFGPDPDVFAKEVREFQETYRRCVQLRDRRKGPSPPNPENNPANTLLRTASQLVDEGKFVSESIQSNSQLISASAFELHREQTERLKLEQRANTYRTALLFAAEAERANNASRYDAGMRFGLSGWLATAQSNEACLDQVKAQLDRGARGIRRIFSDKGSVLHAYYQSLAGSGLIISDDTSLYAQPLPSGERIKIGDFDDWFAVLPGDHVFACYHEGRPTLHSISDILGVRNLEYLYPYHSGSRVFQFHRTSSYHNFVEISVDAKVLLYSNPSYAQIWYFEPDVRCVFEITSDDYPSSWESLSPDGSIFYSDRYRGRIALWETSGQNDLVCDLNILLNKPFGPKISRPTGVRFTLDGQYLHVGYFKTTRHIVSMKDYSFTTRRYLFNEEISTDGIFVFRADGSNIESFMISAYEDKGLVERASPINRSFSQENEKVRFLVRDRGVVPFKLAKHPTIYPSVFNDYKIVDVEISLSGKLACCHWRDSSGEYSRNGVDGVGVFDIESGDQILSFVNCINVAISPDDKVFAVKAAPDYPDEDNGDILFYDRAGKLIGKIESSRIYKCFRFSQDGHFLILYSEIFSPSARDKDIDQQTQIEILDTNYLDSGSTEELIRFICDVKLAGKEDFEEIDFDNAQFKDIPFDLIQKCRALIRDTLGG